MYKDTSIHTTDGIFTSTAILGPGGAQRSYTSLPSTIDPIDTTPRKYAFGPFANIIRTIRVTSSHDNLDRGGGRVNGGTQT